MNTHSLIVRLLGFLLICTGAVKLFTSYSFNSLSSESGSLILAIIEVCLGLWFTSGFLAEKAWFVCICVFLIFFSLTTNSIVVGNESCGCLGKKIQSNPAYFFAINFFAIFLLLRFRPPQLGDNIHKLWTASRSTIGISLVFVLVTLLVVWIVFGSVASGFAYLRGEPISLNTTKIQLGAGPVSEKVTTSILITNHSSTVVKVIGGSSDCSCVTTGDLPVTLQPNQTHELQVYFIRPDTIGKFRKTTWIFTDNPKMDSIPFQITGQVVSDMNP